jgi:uncharacterized lipoprotein YajG
LHSISVFYSTNNNLQEFEILKKFLCVCFAFMLCGCVAGQNIKIGGVPEGAAKESSGVIVELNVNDERPFVTSGDKEPYYIGHYRAGFGNTWDVTTYQKVALAEIMKKDLVAELQSLGYQVEKEGSNKKLVVKINDWNFDTYMNGKLWWDIDVIVIDPSGEVVTRVNLKDKKVIKGSVWVGAKYAFEKAVPEYYLEIIKAIVRDNKAVLNALG